VIRADGVISNTSTVTAIALSRKPFGACTQLFSDTRKSDGGFQSAMAKLDYGPDQIYQPKSKDAYPGGSQTQTQND
jgi:hypothetical protein